MMTIDPNVPRILTRRTVRTARYAVLGPPPAEARRIWFALHGYAQLAPRFLSRFAGAVPPDCCVIAPEGLSRFYAQLPQADGSHLQRVGATWMTREAREDDIADTISWLDELLATVLTEAPSHMPVGLLGFSQGVATATRWMTLGHVQPAMFVAWAGGLAHDVEQTRLRSVLAGTRVTVVRGTSDPMIDSAHGESIWKTLQALQPASGYEQFDGAHQLDASVLARLLDQLPALPAQPQ